MLLERSKTTSSVIFPFSKLKASLIIWDGGLTIAGEVDSKVASGITKWP